MYRIVCGERTEAWTQGPNAWGQTSTGTGDSAGVVGNRILLQLGYCNRYLQMFSLSKSKQLWVLLLHENYVFNSRNTHNWVLVWVLFVVLIFCFKAFVMLLLTDSDGFVLYSFQFWLEAGASSHPCSEIYHGRAAMSEREVRSVANFLQSQGQRLAGYLDIHSYSQILMFPWGYTKRRNRDYEELVHYKIKLLIYVKKKWLGNYIQC